MNMTPPKISIDDFQSHLDSEIKRLMPEYFKNLRQRSLEEKKAADADNFNLMNKALHGAPALSFHQLREHLMDKYRKQISLTDAEKIEFEYLCKSKWGNG